jgi:hypothetical protein
VVSAASTREDTDTPIMRPVIILIKDDFILQNK